MKTVQPISLAFSGIVIILLCTTITAQAADTKPVASGIILEACKNVSSDSFKVRFTHDFCVSTLQPDNRSADAKDYRILALVAVDAMKSQATAVTAKVEKLIQGATKDKIATRALGFCRVDYSGMVSTLEICHDIIQSFEIRKGNEGPTPFLLIGCIEKTTKAINDCADKTEFASISVGLMKEYEDLSMFANLSSSLLLLFITSPPPRGLGLDIPSD
uniref:Pectinesterase inhibitor domain-containing protein n=1 Tax=Hordeum vulgare subsp. vulgare TaxID=112509 RepID=A0A8I6YG48_HORVV